MELSTAGHLLIYLKRVEEWSDEEIARVKQSEKVTTLYGREEMNKEALKLEKEMTEEVWLEGQKLERGIDVNKAVMIHFQYKKRDRGNQK